MIDIFISIFVIAALALIFANSWNLVAESVLQKYEKKNEQGDIEKPIEQTLIYAIIVTIISILALWLISRYTKTDLG